MACRWLSYPCNEEKNELRRRFPISTQDMIRVVERKDGKRHFHEYSIKYTFRIIKTNAANTKVYLVIQHVLYVKIQKTSKEVAINKGKELFESDINHIPMFK